MFISCHHDDIEVAQKIANEMQKISDHVWLDDQEINIGDSIKEKIETGLENSDYFLIILSENSKKNHWADAELAKAIAMGKVVLPVKTDDSEVPESIRNIAYADLRGSFEMGIGRLKRSYLAASHNKAMRGTSR